MGSPCWGAPRQGLMAPTSSEFPDVRLQYQMPRDALPMIKVRLTDIGKSFDDIDLQPTDPNFIPKSHFEIISGGGGVPTDGSF